MPTFKEGFVTVNGDTASASYLNTWLNTSTITFAAGSVLLGNSTGASGTWQEITLGGGLAFSGTALNTIQGIATTSSPTFAAITINGAINRNFVAGTVLLIAVVINIIAFLVALARYDGS